MATSSADQQPSHTPSSLLEDRWVAAAAVIIIALYVALVFIKPGGEGWGRGWNMIAFLIYASPTALAAAGVALWRLSKTERTAKAAAGWSAAAGLAFPIICIVALRMKA